MISLEARLIIGFFVVVIAWGAFVALSGITTSDLLGR